MLIEHLIVIMNVKGVNCGTCHSRMLKMIARPSSDRDITLGYYCPICETYQNNQMIYMVPITVITESDPYLITQAPRSAYDAIIKAGIQNRDRAHYITHDQIIQARDQISEALKPMCRSEIPGEKINRELDREKIRKDLERNFAQCFGPDKK